MAWTPFPENTRGVVLHNYDGSQDEELANGLNVNIGEIVYVLYKRCDSVWYTGYPKGSKETGIIPAIYVDLNVKEETSVTEEVVQVSRDWGQIWKKYFCETIYHHQFSWVGNAIQDLIDGRKQIINGTITQDQLKEKQEKLTYLIDRGNRRLKLDLVPRNGTDKVDVTTVGACKLYQIHAQSVENSNNAGTMRRKSKHNLKCSVPSSTEDLKPLSHFLFASLRVLQFTCTEECDVSFALYDAQNAKYITERWSTTVSSGLPASNFVSKFSNLCALFEDLSSYVLTKDLYMVVRIVRHGRMFYSESNAKKSSQMYKRLHACGVLSLADFCTSGGVAEDKDYTIKIFDVKSVEERDLYLYHEQLIKKTASKATQIGFAMLEMKLLGHTDVSTLRSESDMLLKHAVSTKTIDFPDVIMPGVLRNDVYVTLSHGDFEKGGKATGKTIEATLLVLNRKGERLPMIFESSSVSGAEGYKTVVQHHNNSPKWMETVRLTIPIETFPDVHIRVEFRHCSTKEKNEKKLFGFSFAPLMNDGSTISLSNGPHELIVYKCEDINKLKVENYLSHCFLTNSSNGTAGKDGMPFQKSIKESFTMNTQLYSTKFTQNSDLLTVLKWKSCTPNLVKTTLQRLAELKGDELVKYLQDILDALFTMFSNEDGNSTVFSGDVFLVLINVFSVVEKSKFKHFKPVIEAYLDKHFACALVYKGLLETVSYYATTVISVTEAKQFRQVQSCFQRSEFIFKFIVKSQILFSQATQIKMGDSFRRNVISLFNCFTELLTQTKDELIPTQSELLLNLDKMYVELCRVLPFEDVAEHVGKVFSAIPLPDSAHPLSPAKLSALCHFVKSPLFARIECRNILLPEICRHIRHHLQHREELRLCTNVLSEILIFLHSAAKIDRLKGESHMDQRTHDDIEIVSTATLEMLVQSILILERTSSVVGDLVTCLVATLQLMDDCHYNRLWDDFNERQPIRDLVLNILAVFHNLIKHDVFPDDWAEMKLMTNDGMLKGMQAFCKEILVLESSDIELLKQYFILGVAFIAQPGLQLENVRNAKRNRILKLYGDMRLKMSKEILTLWEHLGTSNRSNFLPSLVGPFLEVSLIQELTLRSKMIPLFYDMLDAEFKIKGHFNRIESEVIDKLDKLVTDDKQGDEHFTETFSRILTKTMDIHQPIWKQPLGVQFINKVEKIYSYLLDYRRVLETDNRDVQMFVLVNLLNFYKVESKREPYLRYVHKLYDMHLQTENYTEAGFSLLLSAEMMSWPQHDSIYGSLLIPDDRMNKEDIYVKVLTNFDKGKVWEKGIPLCKELCSIYEKNYDYSLLSEMLTMQATFFNNILTQFRPDPEYFRVGFFGNGCPLFLRNKEFIYRGLDYERMCGFMQRIISKFPDAIALNNNPPDESILNSDFHYIQICSVKPIGDVNSPFLSSAPTRIRNFYSVNDVDTFQFDRRLPKTSADFDADDEANEFKNMWIERTTMKASSTFPGIMRFFQVSWKEVEILTPVRYACEQMSEVNRSVSTLVASYKNEPGQNINPLTMKLQGIVEAAVMGGSARYRDAFFTQEFMQSNPDSMPYVSKLGSLILEQVRLMNSSLEFHGLIAPPALQPLHKRLVERLAEMKQMVSETTEFKMVCSSPKNAHMASCRSDSLSHIRESFRLKHHNSIINTPLPPVPLGMKADLNKNLNSNRSSASSGYGQIIPTNGHGHGHTGDSDDEDVYSKPGNPETALSSTPPPIPNRQSKRACPRSPIKSCPNTVSNEYIVMPPNRVREVETLRQSAPPSIPPKPGSIPELESSPPLLPKRQPVKVTTPPPVPPKPRSSSSNSSISNSDTYMNRSDLANSNKSSHEQQPEQTTPTKAVRREKYVLPVTPKGDNDPKSKPNKNETVKKHDYENENDTQIPNQHETKKENGNENENENQNDQAGNENECETKNENGKNDSEALSDLL